jgi:glycosyltransferase EpsE
MEKKVAVIMGVYNSKHTLKRAIDSILNQSYKNLEFIICNDGSDDETSNILSDYQKNHNNIILINNKVNCGLAKSLNSCLEKIPKDVVYIARMDSDDYSHENRIEKQVSFLNSNSDVDLVSTKVNLIEDKTGKKMGVRGAVGYLEKHDLLKGPPFIHPTVMIRKTSIKKLGGYNESSSYLRMEDYELWFRFFLLNMKGFCIKEPLFDYYIRPYKPKINETLREIVLRYKYFKLFKFGFSSLIYLIKPMIRYLIPYSLKVKFSILIR